jgi:hypothetical protein
MKITVAVLVGLLCSTTSFAAPNTAPSKVTIDDNNVIAIDGRKVFPIGFTMAPKPETTAPSGKPALEELRDAGALFMRTGPMGQDSNWDKWMDEEQNWQDGAAKAGMYCCPWLKELSAIEPGKKDKEEKLRKVIEHFKDHPGMGIWKGEDEPQWGKKPIPPMMTAYKMIHELDPNHPVWIVQAPRGTLADLKTYVNTYDIGGIDIYPVSYPPGTHAGANYPNREISMVGEWSRLIAQVNDGKKPFWMTLQIAFSGTTPSKSHPNSVIRFPTFEQSRFMAYQAIINGARGLIYFGGNLAPTLSEQDQPLGWNWTFWRRVMRPLLDELGDKSPLEPALTAANSPLQNKIKVQLAANQKRALVPSEMTEKPPEGAPAKADPEEGSAERVGGAAPGGPAGVEYLVREVEGNLYILACKREGATVNVEFSGLSGSGEAEVMFE